MITTLLRIGVGGAFCAAGAMKAWDPQAFQVAVDGFRILPFAATAMVALYLPWLELVAGSVVVLGRWGWRAGLAILAGLTAVFLIVLAIAWLRGLNPDCGCFGSGAGSVSGAVLRDLGLLAGIVWLWWRSWRAEMADNGAQSGFGVQGIPA